MKYNSKKIITYALAAVFIGAGATKTIASSITPGSESDPLVSKSYVDGKLQELENLLSEGSTSGGSYTQVKLSNDDTEDIITDILARLEFEQQNKNGAYFVPVEVKKGEYLIGGEGTEIILRTGRAFVYSKTENGVSDLSAGKDLLNGEAVVKDHYMVIPRDDGRGVIPISDCWFLIKGDYQIK